MTDQEYARMMLVVVLVGVFIVGAVLATLWALGTIFTYQGPAPWLP